MQQSIPQRYFEDFETGTSFEFGDYLMTEGEIIAFGTAYDPQPYHVNRNPGPGFAANELIASGWHTCGATMRMLVDHFIPATTVLPSGGIDAIRWPRPVRPGDRLRVKVTIGEKRPSATKPDRGVIKLVLEVFNQNAELVMSAVDVVLFRRKPAAKAASAG